MMSKLDVTACNRSYCCEAKRQLGVYVHIPFCIKKCDYCDFLSAPADEEVKRQYVKRLLEEIEMVPQTLLPSNESVDGTTLPDLHSYRLRSVFFGGGTPSVLPADLLASVLQTVSGVFKEDTDEDCEITIECNPGTVSLDALRQYRKAGFNRISMGLQSANDSELREIGRIHTFAQFEDSFRMAQQAGFDNINVDLMYGLPGQTQDSLADTLEKVIKWNPAHISVYSLILEEGTPLYHRVNADYPENFLPDEDTVLSMTALVNERLAQAGYSHYEISNYAKPGKECVHNLSYWECKEYLGFGIGAASYYQGVRWKNRDVLAEYLHGGTVKREGMERLSLEERMSEYMFLGLRKVRDGVRLEDFQKQFGCSFESVYGETARKYIQMNLLRQAAGSIVLTPEGVNVSNVIMADFIL